MAVAMGCFLLPPAPLNIPIGPAPVPAPHALMRERVVRTKETSLVGWGQEGRRKECGWGGRKKGMKSPC